MSKLFKSPRIIFILSILFPMWLDSIFTLVGQPPEYWKAFIFAYEGSPLVVLLQTHPLLFLLSGTVSAAVVIFLLVKLPWKLALPFGILVYTGHAWASSGWIPRLLSVVNFPLDWLFIGQEYFVTQGYFVVLAVFLAGGIVLYYKNMPFPEERKANLKQILLVLILGALVYGGILLYGMWEVSKQKVPRGIFADGNLCQQTETGWSCVLTKESKWWEHRKREEFDRFHRQFKQTCEKQGGKLICYGYCDPDYTHFCDFPFTDVNQECVNSNQCKGRCVVSEENLERYCPNREGYSFICEGISGKCAQYPLRECDWFSEVNDGIVTVNMIICD